MHFIHAFYLFLTGIGVGLISGLLGIGGCFIMAPIQFFILKNLGIDPTVAIHIAFGTNLFVVLPTALSASYRHHQKENILWKPAIILGITGAIASFGGAALSSILSANILTKIFGIMILLGAFKMATTTPAKTNNKLSQNITVYVFWGILLGFITGLIGIGGGVLIIPVMTIFLNFNIRKAIGTATAMMIFTALGGSFAYIIFGWNHPGLPPYSLGYVNLLQWIILVSTSIPMAQIGAHLTNKTSTKLLKWLFITIMIYMGLKMIGIFAYLKLPL